MRSDVDVRARHAGRVSPCGNLVVAELEKHMRVTLGDVKMPAHPKCPTCGAPLDRDVCTTFNVCKTFNPRTARETHLALWEYCTGCEYARKIGVVS